ncbi:MAG: hypothetical protein Kow0029_05010 [Candidatus Rifleibacteriota bacterium]
MKKTDRFFGEVLGADENLLQLKDLNFAVRSWTEDEIKLFSLSGKMLRIVSEKIGFAPNSIVCKNIPHPDENTPKEGWILDYGILRVPFVTKLELNKLSIYKSLQNIAVSDFPGHMKNLIVRRLRQADFAGYKELERRMKVLVSSVQEYLTESVEIPLLDVIGFGEGKLSAGDSALCGLLLTGRCFSLGKRFRVNWYARLTMEVRRLFHKTDLVGKNWLCFALEGRLSQVQKKFFEAMVKDFECADEIVVNEVADDNSFNGKAFLIGVLCALNMVQDGLFKYRLS